jgi:hypothetical protein
MAKGSWKCHRNNPRLRALLFSFLRRSFVDLIEEENMHGESSQYNSIGPNLKTLFCGIIFLDLSISSQQCCKCLKFLQKENPRS